MPKKENHSQLSQRDHILKRVEVYGGPKGIQEYSSLVPTKTFDGIEKYKAIYSKLLKKFIDEISTNAIDRVRAGNEVKNIWHDIEHDLSITIVNDGNPMGLHMKQNLAGVNMPLPQFLVSEFNTSSNFDDDREIASLGGVNGVGIKLVNVWSTMFIVEVYDRVSRQFFQQIFSDNMGNIGKYYLGSKSKFSGVRICDHTNDSYTAFKFIPDYERIGYTSADTGNLYNIMSKLLRTQAMVAAISSQTKPGIRLTKNKVAVWYKGKVCPLSSIYDIALMNTTPIINLSSKDTDSNEEESKAIMPIVEFMMGEKTETPWHVVLSCDASKGLEQSNFSIVNGIYTVDGGTHVDYIRDGLANIIKEQFAKKYPTLKWQKMFINYIQIYVNAIFNNPEFESQKKDLLTTPKAKFKTTHPIDESVIKAIKKISKYFFSAVDDLMMLKSVKDDAKNSVDKTGKEYVEKYTKAHKLGLRSTLCICEGESAKKSLDGAIKQSSGDSSTYIGSLALQGVIPNGLKESKLITDPSTKEIVRIRSNKLQQNKHIRELYSVTKLLPSCRYIVGIDDDKFAKLNYGALLIVSDQDYDGYNIQSLVLALIAAFHPGLFERGWVKILNTPIIKATIKEGTRREIKNFHTIVEYEEWAKLGTKHDCQYVKGLASLETVDMVHVLNYINCNTFLIKTLSKDDLKQLNIYYGPDPDLRKKCLSEVCPAVDIILPKPSCDLMVHDKKTKKKKIQMEDAFEPLSINLEQHLHGRAHPYQLDRLGRQLPNIMDGLTESKRKVLYNIMLLPDKTVIKVIGLAGKMMDNGYVHGDASASSVIINMTRNYYNCNNIGQMTSAKSQTGTRSDKIAGSPRYTFAVGNTPLLKVLYNKSDIQMVEKVMEDNHKYEPKFYLPPVPIVILNSYSSISVGWNCGIYARDYKQCVQNIKNMIAGKPATEMDHDSSNFRGDVVKHLNIEYSCGKYKYDSKRNMITITELPIFVFTNIFINGSEPKKCKKYHDLKNKVNAKKATDAEALSLTKATVPAKYKLYVKEVIDHSHKIFPQNMDINIEIYLEDGAWEKIAEYAKAPFDGVMRYFGLMTPMRLQLNLITDVNTVTTFSSYTQILDFWYERRRPFYEARYAREKTLLEIRKLYLENIIRFCHIDNKDQSNSIVSTKNSIDKAIELLKKYKYTQFNIAVMNNSDGIPNGNLVEAILQIGASYDYILNLTTRQRLKDSNADRIKEYKKVCDEYDSLVDQNKYFDGAQLWLNDLDNFLEQMTIGIENDWSYGASHVDAIRS